MATKVVKELAVAVAQYEDRQTGQTKNRYENVGVLMESTNDRGEINQFLMLNRSFSPAGAPFKPGSDKILISMFDPRPRDGQQGRQQRPQTQQSAQAGGQSAGYDDEIPF